jgi:hypothetical protein
VPAAEFFREMGRTGQAGQYRKLRRALESALEGVRVFRAGSVKVDVYVIGKTRSGDWAGLHTTSVET